MSKGYWSVTGSSNKSGYHATDCCANPHFSSHNDSAAKLGRESLHEPKLPPSAIAIAIDATTES